MRSTTGTRPPETLGNGRYLLQQPLGIGGMAAVYTVLDRWYGVQRAAKLLLPHNAINDKTRTRFLAEARTMAQLDHPNIIRIHDIGHEGAHWYFVMELAEDGNLATWMRRHGRASPRQALQFMHQVLLGLEHAHLAGVVHRDVKPHNMLLTDQRVKLTDFGIARVLGAVRQVRLTGTGDTLGTLAYMSPEQRVDPRKAGPATDIYSVGATLYILLTGRRPFDLATLPADTSTLRRLPPPLRPIVAKAAAHHPADRYTTAREMAEEVARAWEQIPPEEAFPGPTLRVADPHDDATVLHVRPDPRDAPSPADDEP